MNGVTTTTATATAHAAALLNVEVVCSPVPGEVEMSALQLPAGATVGEALRASGVLERHPQLATDRVVGIWGRRTSETTPLRDGDRVELYRPLTVDPKEARRLRYRGQAGAGRKRVVRR